MKRSITAIGASMLIILSGCVTNQHAIKNEMYDQMKEAPPAQRATAPGSLWTGESNRNMLFADNKAMYLYDIITITINETSVARNDASTNTARSSSTDAKISALLGMDTSILNKNASMGTQIAASGSTTSTLKGSGDTNRGNTLKLNITGRVIKVLENGNLLIEGRKQVTINAENQYIVITGIIRPEDVSADNYVDSKNIADARIVYTGAGVIAEKQKPGWGTRVIDYVWPF
jgi:flagellar L-ring protein FlgH